MTYNGYRFGVMWIALNDEPLDMDVDSVAGFISTLLLADLHEKDPKVVAQDIIKYRTEHYGGHVKMSEPGFWVPRREVI